MSNKNKEQEPPTEVRKERYLILSRKEKEGIFISPGTPDEIYLKVLAIGKKRVKIGIEAPLAKAIAREEKTKNSE